MIMHSTFKLTAISAALMAIYGLAQAADDAEMRELTQPDSSVSVGVGHVSGDRQQFGKYDGVTDSETHLILDADVRKRDEATGTWMTFGARNLGLDNRQLNAGYDRQGDWGVSVDYNQIPSNNPLKFMTGVRGVGTTTLQYGTPGATAGAAQTGLYPATSEVHLGTERDVTSLGFYKYLMPDLSLNITFKNEEKDGTQLWGRGSNPEFAVQPINWTTRQLDAILNYTGKQLQLSGGLSGSWFENHNAFVDTIGGSQTTAAGVNYSAGHAILSMPLDNQAYQAYVDGGYNFTKSTRGTFKVSYSHATQNDSLDPIANALLATGGTGSSSVLAGTPSSLNGVVNTKLIDLGITSRPINKLALVAKLKYDKKDDKTPEQIFGTGLTNHPYDMTKWSAKLEGTYQLPDGYSLTAGADRDKRDRTLPTVAGVFEGTVKMRTETDETTWRLQARRNLSETLNGSLAYLYSKRNGSVWEGPEAETTTVSKTYLGYVYADQSQTTTAFTNPFAWADRTRDKWRLVLDWAPTETVSLQFNYETSKDDYVSAKSGLQSGSAELISLDANLAINQDWQLNGWLSQDTTKAHQIGITYDPRTTGGLLDPATGLAYTTLPGAVGWLCSSANPAGTGTPCQTDLVWDAQLKDTGKTIGIGIQGNATSKLKVGANLQWTETVSQYPIGSNVPTYITSTNKSKQGLPDITTTMTRIALFGQYAMEKNADIRFDLVHQRYKSDDWTMMEWNSTGTSLVPFTYMDGTTVTANQSQSSTFVGARYIYKFQ